MPVVIANPVARGSRAAVATLERLGVDDVRWTTDRMRAGALTQAALDEGASSLIVVGGDGTVRDAAERIVGGDVPLGIMPSGTANLFARNLDLPVRSHARAARIALEGTVGRIDLGRVELTTHTGATTEHSFLVVVGIGHDASAVAAASLKRKRRLGWTAYVEAGVRRFAAPPFEVHARFDDTEASTSEAWTVLVHNAARIPAGLRIVPGTRPDDGFLHVAVVSPRRLAHWGRIAASGMGLARTEGILAHRRTHRVVLESDDIPVQVDGDALGAIASLEAWIEPGVLPMRLGAAA